MLIYQIEDGQVEHMVFLLQWGLYALRKWCYDRNASNGKA